MKTFPSDPFRRPSDLGATGRARPRLRRPRSAAPVRFVPVPLLLLIAVALLVPRAGAQSATPTFAEETAAVDAAYRQAFLSGNYAALEEVFAPDAVEISPAGVFRGGPAIRGLAEAFVRANPGTSISYGETTVVENTAVHRAFVASDPIRETGVERIVLLHTLVVSQGRVITLTSAWDLGDPETVRYLAAAAPAMDAGPAAPGATPPPR